MRRILVTLAILSSLLIQVRGVAAAPREQASPGSAGRIIVAQRPTLRRGAAGAAVSELQRRLNVWVASSRSRIRPLPVTGVFGIQTDAVVRAFQRSKRLRATGIVGAATWAALPALPVAVAPTVQARIKDLEYLPHPLRVRAGTTVTWTNNDVVEHSVTHGRWSPSTGVMLGGAFDSGLYKQGKAWSFKFTRPGQYAYFCTLHPAMQSIVVVTR
ncbi:MAG TPA: peptidoglycan-binding protein [Herpetosiphonaceae bacterium]|nr:peptidoglycan-binding protein [Herpetosiphonaceae bacterium]